MALDFNTVNNILQTLPISYYLKRKIENVELSATSDTSYINLYDDKICISFKQLQNFNVNDSTLESDIRTILYHEVSHALLTYKRLYITDFVNICEDERIESICNNYYHDVDFKSFVKRQYTKPATNSLEYFYQVVRFRIGQQNDLQLVEEFIKKWSIIIDNTNFVDYYEDCEKLYNTITQSYNNMQNNIDDTSNNIDNSNNNIDNNTNDNTSNSNSSNNVNDNTNNNTLTINNTNDNDNTLTINDSNDNEKTDNLNNQLLINTVIEQLNNTYRQLGNDNVKQTLSNILFSNKKRDSLIGSANSYSGRFDVRSVGRDDYKYFIHKNVNGSNKQFSKIKLNLFIDVSGSFSSSETKVNDLLFTLKQLEHENEDFTFDLVTMNTEITLKDKLSRSIHCSAANDLTPDLPIIFNKLQDPKSKIINIVLFDGYALSSRNAKQDNSVYLSAFNTRNTIIISDESNKLMIKRNCPKANTTILQSDYCNKFISTITTELQKVFRIC